MSEKSRHDREDRNARHGAALSGEAVATPPRNDGGGPRLARFVAAIAEGSGRRPWVVLAIWAMLAGVAVAHLVRHFSIDTDTTKLVRADLPWRQREINFDRLFPQRTDLIVVVIDGATPEIAEQAAAAMYAHALTRKDLFRSVRRPDGGAFFDRNGMLFLPRDALAATLEHLIAAQPLLGSLAQDPSLRGIVSTMTLFAQGLASGAPPSAPDEALHQLTDAFDALAAVFEAAARGEMRPLAWSSLMRGQPPDPRELRRFVLAQPVLHYDALLSGEDAADALRAMGNELGLTADRGVRIRLTGPVPLADEELATLEAGGVASAAITLSLLVILLAIGVRSAKLVVAILTSLSLALAVTAGAGLALVGSFNLISVAFAVLCVGLGVDFGIQIGVSYRAHRSPGVPVLTALRGGGMAIGGGLAVAACATAAGFFSFLPTDYRGVSELGLVAGFGMLLAFAASITVLPALVALFAVRGARDALGFAALAPLNQLLLRRWRFVLMVTAALAIASLAAMPGVRFDADPLHLRSPATESVSTLLDLSADPLTSPDSIDVLTASADAAQAMADRLAKLPGVAQALTLDSFIPEGQDEKLPLIADAAALMLPMLDAPAPPNATSDDADAAAMREAAASLRALAAAPVAGAAKPSAERLAAALDALAGPTAAAARGRARDALVPGLQGLLRQLREALQAQRVTRASLPHELVADWVAADGQARVEVFPAGDAKDARNRERFVAAVTAVAPDATGPPISIAHWGATIVRAFVQAGLLACVAVAVLLAFVLRRFVDVVIALAVLLLSGLFTLALCVVLDQPLNFENIIALPLLFGVGVAFNVYFLIAWREGQRRLLQSSLARAILFSALTTASAFGSLWLSVHPGTASMGKLLVVSLSCTLACTMLVLPALLAWRSRRDDG